MSKGIFKDVRPLLWRAALASAVFVLVGQAGLLLREPLEEINRSIGHWGWFAVITEPSMVQAVWAAVLSVHAAVGAIAPLLGYTLFATTVTSATRIAPAGAVIARTIRWSQYLKNSLVLLIGSLAGLVLAPSAAGLMLAAIAATFVAIRTLIVFLRGFDLLERPEHFDDAARKYLKSAVPIHKPLQGADKNLALAINEDLRKLASHDYGAKGPYASLLTGDVSRATQLIAVEPRAVQRLASEANKLGLELYRAVEQIPFLLGRGRHVMLGVRPVSAATLQGSPPVSSAPTIPREDVSRLQALLDSLVVFGRGDRIDEMTRLPMLANRHIASLLYEAIPTQQPQNFPYGLDVLGGLIDAAFEGEIQTELDALDIFDWVHEIPSFLAEQVCEAPHSRALYARHMTSFLRQRVVKWINYPRMDAVSAAYVRYLLKVLRCSILRMDRQVVEGVTSHIREIPAIARIDDMRGLRVVLRDMIALYVHPDIAKRSFRSYRREILKAIRYSVIFGYRGDKGVAFPEVVAGVAALSLYKNSQSTSYATHVVELIDVLLGERNASIASVDDVLLAISRAESMAEEWRWTWWELDQLEREEAHFVSMGIWIRRALVLLLAKEAWKLSFLENERLPGLDILTLIRRDIESIDDWGELPDDTVRELRSMLPTIDDLVKMREAFVEKRVASSAIDPAKCGSYIDDVLKDIDERFGAYNRWLNGAGCVEVPEGKADGHQAGIGHLVPREWFVPEGVVDIPIMALPPAIGWPMAEFELRRIVEVARAGREPSLVSEVHDQGMWEEAEALAKQEVPLLIIGIGVSEYDAYERVARVREIYGDSGKQKFLFETIRDRDAPREVLMLDASRAFKVVRLTPTLEGKAIVERSTLPEDGGVSVRLAEIDSEMEVRWLESVPGEEHDEMIAKYRESLLFQVAWSFDVVRGELGAMRWYRLQV